MVKKEKDDFLAAQGFAAANCLISVHPETGDFQILRGFEPGYVCFDPRQIRLPDVVGNQNSVD